MRRESSHDYRPGGHDHGNRTDEMVEMRTAARATWWGRSGGGREE